MIDIDSEAAKGNLKKITSEYELDAVPRTRTGKSWQLFFKHPGVMVQNKAGVGQYRETGGFRRLAFGRDVGVFIFGLL